MARISKGGAKRVVLTKMVLPTQRISDVVDKVISETGLSSKELIKNVKKELQTELALLSQKTLEELLEERYQRFRKY